MTQARLKELLDYDPATGVFQWRVSPSPFISSGTVAGTPTAKGYIRICVDRRPIMAHRLAWLFVYGKLPSSQLDHINTVQHDNRIDNLREATQTQNLANSHARRNGLKGVKLDKRRGTYEARIRKNGVLKHIGCFRTEEAAHEAYMLAAKERFGEFARAG